MQIITAKMMLALEIMVGVRAPVTVPVEVLSDLATEGLLARDGFTGVIIPTEAGVRATAPQYMKDITP